MALDRDDARLMLLDERDATAGRARRGSLSRLRPEFMRAPAAMAAMTAMELAVRVVGLFKRWRRRPRRFPDGARPRGMHASSAIGRPPRLRGR